MKRILVIEDEKILAEIYRDKLSQFGYKVSLAFSVNEALELIKKEKPNLILLDVLLPVENGISFLKRFKEMPEFVESSVIVLSNYDHPETKREAKELGAKEYLIKTQFTPSELVKKIKEYLQNNVI